VSLNRFWPEYYAHRRRTLAPQHCLVVRYRLHITSQKSISDAKPSQAKPLCKLVQLFDTYWNKSDLKLEIVEVTPENARQIAKGCNVTCNSCDFIMSQFDGNWTIGFL
jgi:hypothetical protein